MGDIMWNPLERSLHLIRVLLYWGLSFDISNIQLNPGYSLSGFLCFMSNPYECYPGDVIEYW